MRDEYDFSNGTRGTRHKAYRAGTNRVVLAPNLVEADTDAAPADQALLLPFRSSHSKAVSKSSSPVSSSRVRRKSKVRRS